MISAENEKNNNNKRNKIKNEIKNIKKLMDFFIHEWQAIIFIIVISGIFPLFFLLRSFVRFFNIFYLGIIVKKYEKNSIY